MHAMLTIWDFCCFFFNATIRGYPLNEWLSRSPETDDNISNFSEDNAPLRKHNDTKLLYDQKTHRTVHILHRASFHYKGITKNRFIVLYAA